MTPMKTSNTDIQLEVMDSKEQEKDRNIIKENNSFQTKGKCKENNMRKNSYKEPQVHGRPESKMKLKREQSRNNLEHRSYSTKTNLTINDQDR